MTFLFFAAYAVVGCALAGMFMGCMDLAGHFDHDLMAVTPFIIIFWPGMILVLFLLAIILAFYAATLIVGRIIMSIKERKV